MKTLFLYETFGEGESFFFELEGDYSHLHDTFVNAVDSDEDKVDELTKLTYDENWQFKVTKLKEPTKDWTHFAHVGFLP